MTVTRAAAFDPRQTSFRVPLGGLVHARHGAQARVNPDGGQIDHQARSQTARRRRPAIADRVQQRGVRMVSAAIAVMNIYS